MLRQKASASLFITLTSSMAAQTASPVVMTAATTNAAMTCYSVLEPVHEVFMIRVVTPSPAMSEST